MLIGIKYCGGCNPRYDRSKFIKLLNKKLPSCKFEIISLIKEYDYVFIVCGCDSICANAKNIKSKNPLIYIKSEQDFEKLSLISS